MAEQSPEMFGECIHCLNYAPTEETREVLQQAKIARIELRGAFDEIRSAYSICAKSRMPVSTLKTSLPHAKDEFCRGARAKNILRFGRNSFYNCSLK